MERAWVECMDAGGRAMQEQLPRGDEKTSFSCAFTLKNRKIAKENCLRSPRPNPLQQERA